MNSESKQKLKRLTQEIHALRNELKRKRSERAFMFLDTGQVHSVDEALFLVGRKRDRDFLAMVLRNLGQGMTMDDALEDSTRRNFDQFAMANRDSVMKKANAKMAQPDIQNAFTQAMDVLGFRASDALQSYVGHIKGTHTKEVVTKEGEVVEVRIPPNASLAKDAVDRFFPKEPTRIQVQSVNTNVDVAKIMRDAERREDDGPTMRRVGPVMDTDAMLSTDEDPFADDDDDESEDD